MLGFPPVFQRSANQGTAHPPTLIAWVVPLDSTSFKPRLAVRWSIIIPISYFN